MRLLQNLFQVFRLIRLLAIAGSVNFTMNEELKKDFTLKKDLHRLPRRMKHFFPHQRKINLEHSALPMKDLLAQIHL